MKSFSPASVLIETLANQGCRIWVSGDKLRVSDPERMLTDDLRQAIREHKPALLALLRSEPANDPPRPCPTCGDTERWPTTRGPVCPTCCLAAHAPEPVSSEWVVERDLSPESVAGAFQRYLKSTYGGNLPDLPHGALLSRFNMWLEAHGKRPTTLPALRTALGMAEVSSPGA